MPITAVGGDLHVDIITIASSCRTLFRVTGARTGIVHEHACQDEEDLMGNLVYMRLCVMARLKYLHTKGEVHLSTHTHSQVLRAWGPSVEKKAISACVEDWCISGAFCESAIDLQGQCQF